MAIGSSVNLGRRFRDYFTPSHISHSRHGMPVYRAILKYGHQNFTLEILEICDASEINSREQDFFNLLNPDYNVLPNAHSSLGYKHTPETLLKFKERKLTPEQLDKLRSHLAVLNTSDEHKEISRRNMIKLNESKGFSVEVFDMESKKTEVFNSIRKAAEAIGCVHRTIILADETFRKKGITRPIKKRYLVKIIKG